MRFPIMIKTVQASATSISHKMAIIISKKGILEAFNYKYFKGKYLYFLIYKIIV